MTLWIGQQLRLARENRKFSLEQVAQATRIRLRYLEALEAGDFSKIPSTAQARGIIRTIAPLLNIDPEPLLAAMALGSPPEGYTAGDDPSPALREENPTQGNTDPNINLASVEAEAIFVEIGARLRSQRELLGLSLNDVERHTHLRMHYLKALESGKLVTLPSPVQGRGMLSNYANFLGLNPEPLLLRFADGLQASLATRKAAQTPQRFARSAVQVGKPNLFRRLFSVDILVVGTLVIFFIVFIIWAGLRISSQTSVQGSTPTSPSIANVLAPATPTPPPTNLATDLPLTMTAAVILGTPQASLAPQTLTAQTLAPDTSLTPQPTQTSTANSNSPVQVYVVVRQRAWLRVTVDGKVEFEGRVVTGGAYTFAGSQQVEVLTGNGAALQVIFNQADQGTLGQLGAVVDLIYTPTGVINPTPTVTPTGAALTLTPTPGRTLIPGIP